MKAQEIEWRPTGQMCRLHLGGSFAARGERERTDREIAFSIHGLETKEEGKVHYIYTLGVGGFKQIARTKHKNCRKRT